MKHTKKLAAMLSAVMIISALPTAVGASAKQAKSVNTVSTEITMYAGSAYQLKPNSGKITYKTENKQIARVTKSGLIKARKKGTANITATNAKTKKTIRYKVKVKKPVGYKVSCDSGKYNYI